MTNKNEQTSWGRLPFAEIISRIIKFFGGWLLAGLLTSVGALAFFLWLAEEVFEGDTKNFDDGVRNYVHQFAAPSLTAAMKFFSFIGSPLVLSILGFIVIGAFFILKWRRGIILFLITMAGELALDLTLKAFYQRARPEAFFDYALPSSYSFPSGHALGSFCFFGIVAWLITARLENKLLKLAVWTTAIFFIFAIGLSRIYLGVHYPSDVLAGYTAGLVWVVVVALGDFWLKRRGEKSVRNSPSLQS